MLELTCINKDSLETTQIENIDSLIWAVGRVANTNALNLASTGIKLNETGFVKVDEYQETCVKGLYALGDVCGIEMLTPVAIAGMPPLTKPVENSQIVFLDTWM